MQCHVLLHKLTNASKKPYKFSMNNSFVLHVTNVMSSKSETTQKTDHKADAHSFFMLDGFNGKYVH
jgi:hypothetical protein